MQPQVTDSLVIRGLNKTFSGTQALKDLDISLRQGEVHGLVGQNGSGKSTLIKILAGYHKPDAGSSATVHGRPFMLGNSEDAHAAGIRFVHQDLAIVDSASAVENLALGFGYQTGPAYRIRWRSERQRASALIRRLGHDFDVDLPMSELSTVERTTVALARAIQDWQAHGQGILVLDEPTANMTQSDVRRMLELIRTLQGQGATVVYVSHHLDEVFAVADRITILRDGRKIETLDARTSDVDHVVATMCGETRDDPPPRAQVEYHKVVLEAAGLSGSTVSRLDLAVHAGEIVGVAGVNGSGREEIGRLIFGGLPRRGEVRVGGTTVPALRPDRAVEAGVGFIPADRRGLGLLVSMTVRENLTLATLGAYWSKYVLQSKRELSDVETWLDRLHIVPRDPDAEVDVLSGGNQQKVVIGKWLSRLPILLILDDPTQGVDVGAKAEIHRLIDEAAESGTAVLVCSSDESELVRLCSRVVVMRHGKVAAVLERDEVSTEAITRFSTSEVETSDAREGQ